MAEPTYPYGYARPPNGGPQGMGTRLTWTQMMTKKTVYNLHPEFRRRFHRMIEYAWSVGCRSASVPAGGSSPTRRRPASPSLGTHGMSRVRCPRSRQRRWRSTRCRTSSGTGWVATAAAFGLRVFTNVNNEPWHAQPVDIPTGRRYATVLPPLKTWNLPGTPSTPDKPPPTMGGTFTLQLEKTLLTPARRAELRGNGDVYLIQQISRGTTRSSATSATTAAPPTATTAPGRKKPCDRSRLTADSSRTPCAGRRRGATSSTRVEAEHVCSRRRDLERQPQLC